MKMLISLFILVLSFSALADRGETKSFVFDGSQNSVELLLRGTKTHTEYRYEEYRTTCSRTETYYRTVCTPGGYRTVCRSTPRGNVCQTIPGPTQCHQRPEYRTVYYPCTQSRQIPYQVDDYQVEARVIVDVTNLSEVATPGEKINVTLTGDVLSYTVEGSKKFFVVKKKEDARATMNGSVKMIDGLLAVELIEAAPLLKALSLNNIKMNNDTLTFDLGQVESREKLGFELKVEKKKFLSSDKVLLDRALLDSEVEVTATAEGATAAVNVSNLGVELKDGKFEITAKAVLKLGGQLMNNKQYETLSASKSLIYKVK